MRTTKLIGLGLIAALTLAGCVAPAKKSDNSLLESYCFARADPLTSDRTRNEFRAEISKRNLLSEEQLDRADAQDVKIGDTFEHVIAAWGRPDGVSNIETAEGFFQHLRWKPNQFGAKSGGRVYLRNGIVTGISR